MPNQVKKNWRDASITPSMAKDVSSTNMLDGLSRETSSQKETNETKEYSTSRTSPGSLGGKDAHE